jgi:hypothetical protein
MRVTAVTAHEQKTYFDDRPINLLMNRQSTDSRHGKLVTIKGEKLSSSRITLNVTFCVSPE